MKAITREQIDEYICNCPYFGGKNTIDRSKYGTHIGSCDLEYHYEKICPSEKCHCADIMRQKGWNDCLGEIKKGQ